MGKLKKKIDYILKHNLLIQKIYKVVLSNLFVLIGYFVKVDDKLILFNSHGRKYNDSPKSIYLYMKNNKEYKNYKFIWALDEPDKYEELDCDKIKMDTFGYFIAALKSKFWVSCVNIERGLNFKKKETVYLNTWHGVPLKYVGNSINERKDYDFSNIDLFCYSGDYEIDIYKKAFNIKPESLLLSGMPRNDQLYKKNKKDEYKEKLGLPKNKKIILYAPTWRDSKDSGDNYELDPPINLEIWEKELSSDFIVLLRTHSYTDKLVGVKCNDFIRDFTDYPDINDLMIASDILISDYSATIFDYSILEKPILLFAYDIEEYSRKRGLYLDIEKEFVNSVYKNEIELIKYIKVMDYKEECRKSKEIKTKYMKVGGNATQKCVEALFGYKQLED